MAGELEDEGFVNLLGCNGLEAFQETAAFLLAFRSSGVKIVVPSEARWNGKAYQLMTMTDLRRRRVSRLFHSLLRDRSRNIRVNTEETVTSPPESYDWVPSEDTHLVRAYDATGADVLVTTDEPLAQAIAKHDGINCRLRNCFLPGYRSRDVP